MPGGVPVGTLAIGKAGATNAGLLALSISRTRVPIYGRGSARSAPSRRKESVGTITVTKVIAPGAALGVLGSGQLGRMFAIAARRMGYRVHTFSPDADTPTGPGRRRRGRADYEDLDALRSVRAPGRTSSPSNLRTSRSMRSTPSRRSRLCGHAAWRCIRRQQRAREKQFLADRGFPTAPFAEPASARRAVGCRARIGTPSVIKTAAFGYDGKGQHKGTTPADVEHIWTAIGHQEAVVEKFVSLQTEISVIGVARRRWRDRALSGRSRTDTASTSWT
jgi:5-(carboxyamino)imidazole ribonucleotide synthase